MIRVRVEHVLDSDPWTRQLVLNVDISDVDPLGVCVIKAKDVDGYDLSGKLTITNLSAEMELHDILVLAFATIAQSHHIEEKNEEGEVGGSG